MNFLEYQEQAMRTAIYPEAARVHYPVLKLAGEAGEAADKFLSPLPEEGPTSILAELGDILWYAAALARDLGAKEEWMSEPLSSLEAEAHQNESDPAASSERGLLKCVLRVAAAATLPVERLGKLIRDHGASNHFGLEAWSGMPTKAADEAADWMLGSLSALVPELAVLSRALGSSLEAVAAANLEKLASRQARGVLQGSGDAR